MKLIFSEWEISFELKTDITNSLVVENHKLFEKMVESLFAVSTRNNEQVMLYDNGETVKLNKRMEIISSPIDFEYSKRNVQKKLFDEIIEDFQIAGIDAEIAELYGKVASNIEKILVASDYHLDYKDDFEITDILKSFDVFLESPEGSFVEKAIDYFSTMHRLLGKDLFFLANCDAYIDPTEYKMLCEWAIAEEVCIVNLRNQSIVYEIQEKTTIIDNDYCIIQ